MSSGSDDSGGRGSEPGGASVVYVALGSNLGDSERIVREAMVRLQQFSDQPLRRSSLWRSEPVDCPPGSPPFVNAAAGLVPRPGETPLDFFVKLQRLEQEFGRKKKAVQNEPRPLDLDLIAFGQTVLVSEALILPHPRAHVRRFVLEPLAEIAPDLVLPGQSKRIRLLLEELGAGEAVARIPDTLPPQNTKTKGTAT